MSNVWKGLWAFRSRKVQVALATILVAVAAEYGLQVDESVIYTILGIGASLIGGIAFEDAARKLVSTPE